jgi:hypothetical protein
MYLRIGNCSRSINAEQYGIILWFTYALFHVGKIQPSTWLPVTTSINTLRIACKNTLIPKPGILNSTLVEKLKVRFPLLMQANMCLSGSNFASSKICMPFAKCVSHYCTNKKLLRHEINFWAVPTPQELDTFLLTHSPKSAVTAPSLGKSD